jgi:plasmid stabilization system protein ParE
MHYQTAYVVVYRVKDTRLEILRILPGMRDLDSLLNEELPET